MGWLGMVASIKLPKKNGLQRLFHKKLGSSSSSGSQTCIFGFVSSFLWVWVFLLKLCRTDLEISGRSQLIVKHYILNFDCKKGCLNVKHPTCFFQSAFCFQKHKPKRRRFFRFPPKKSSTPNPPPPPAPKNPNYLQPDTRPRKTVTRKSGKQHGKHHGAVQTKRLSRSFWESPEPPGWWPLAAFFWVRSYGFLLGWPFSGFFSTMKSLDFMEDISEVNVTEKKRHPGCLRCKDLLVDIKACAKRYHKGTEVVLVKCQKATLVR